MRDGQTDGRADRKTDRRTDRQTDRHGLKIGKTYKRKVTDKRKQRDIE